MAGLGVWFRRLLGGKAASDPSSSLPRARSTSGAPVSFAQANNDFALALYGQLRQQPGNVFFSPFSIRTALAMTEAGARGETAAQLRAALRISPSDAAPHDAFAAIIQRLNAAGGGRYEMAVANSLWGQDGAPLQPAFLDLMVQHYGGALNLVDFRRAAETARATINGWVEDQTKQRIRGLIPPGGLNADTSLVLANAIYFKGTWVLQFDSERTRDQPFHVEDGGTVQVPLMRQQETVRYMQAGGFQAVNLDYEGDDLSMLVLLPDKKGRLRDLEKALSARMLHDCVTQMVECAVDLFLPRFTMTSATIDLRDPLTALGMTLAFTPFRPDFSGINGHAPPDEESLFLSAVFHKAFVEVNEEGTEAAAATATVGTFGSMPALKPVPVPVFRADHPFLFAIRDQRSGTILFLGRIVDPSRATS